MREVFPAGVFQSIAPTQVLMFLKDKNSPEGIVLWISPEAGIYIASLVQGGTLERPPLHDLFFVMLTESGCTVESAAVTDLVNDTFVGCLSLKTPKGEKDLDARPSDAVAMALRAGAPVFVEEKLFEQCAMVLTDHGTFEPAPRNSKANPKTTPPVSDEERKKLKAFEDAFKDLDLNP